MNENAKKLRALMQATLAEAEAINVKYSGEGADPMPVEESQRLEGIYGKFDQYKAQLDMVNRHKDAEDFLNEPTEPKTADVSWRRAAPTEGDAPHDPKAWREITVKQVRIDPIFGVKVVDDVVIRYNVPIAVEQKGYRGAFENYMRNGKGALTGRDFKTLTEGTDNAGGFLVPEDYQTELIKKMATLATIRARARVATTSRDIGKWPKIKYTADDKYTSGVRMSWTGESPASGTSHRVTDPEFGLYQIPIHTAMASMPLSNDLVEDSAFDILGISSDLLAEAFNLGENDAFLNGNGISRPMGILAQVDNGGPASIVSVNASTLTADGLIDLVYALPAQYESNATLITSKATEKVIRKLKDANNNYLWPIWPQQGGFAPAPRDFLGFPALRDEFMPGIAAGAYPALFGDLKGYLVLDRVGLSVQRLSEIYAENNITLLLARKRLGGQTIEPWRMKVQKVGA